MVASRRTPLNLRELADGSYLSVLGYGRRKVRIIEALATTSLAFSHLNSHT
jgi:hypothetical protein